MSILQHFERKVEIKAEKMLRHKRFYAWILIISLTISAIRLTSLLIKLFSIDWKKVYARCKDKVDKKKEEKYVRKNK
jgi:hypothetical protein